MIYRRKPYSLWQFCREFAALLTMWIIGFVYLYWMGTQ